VVGAGAEVILIATNTMHMVFDQVAANVDVPMLSLLDAVGEAIRERDMETVGLLGTSITMETPFYQRALAEKGINVIVPDPDDRKLVNHVIYQELVAGDIRDESRQAFVRVIHRLARRGAEGVILGCTEIPLLVSEGEAGMPLFDTTMIHAEAALRYAVEG
jgi:aspartate racemase